MPSFQTTPTTTSCGGGEVRPSFVCCQRRRDVAQFGQRARFGGRQVPGSNPDIPTRPADRRLSPRKVGPAPRLRGSTGGARSLHAGRWRCKSFRTHGGRSAAVARRVVVAEVAGSSTAGHPTIAPPGQWVERPALTREVAGPTPARGTPRRQKRGDAPDVHPGGRKTLQVRILSGTPTPTIH